MRGLSRSVSSVVTTGSPGRARTNPFCEFGRHNGFTWTCQAERGEGGVDEVSDSELRLRDNAIERRLKASSRQLTRQPIDLNLLLIHRHPEKLQVIRGRIILKRRGIIRIGPGASRALLFYQNRSVCPAGRS